MVKKLFNRFKNAFGPKALILMYHRIAELPSDVWDIAVSPTHFEQQLQILKKSGKVISLKALASDLQGGSLKGGSIAITFDDGYADNFEVARPLLEKWGLPATFFITSGNIEQEQEFWWDELEQLILFTEELPQLFSLEIGGKLIEADLGTEARLSQPLLNTYRKWQACEQEAPGKRALLYWQLWQTLQLMEHKAQQQALSMLHAWAGKVREVRPSFKSMKLEQLKQLAQQPLFDIGIHTVTHPALAFHSEAYQRREIRENKEFLEQSIGKNIRLMAYPFGNHSDVTVDIAAEVKLLAAVTTKEQPVGTGAHLYRLGRFQVKNWNGERFQQQLKAFERGKN